MDKSTKALRPFMLPDYFDGTATLASLQFKIFHKLLRVAPYGYEEGDKIYYPKDKIIKFCGQELHSLFLELIRVDKSFGSLLTVYKDYLLNGKCNYIFSKGLVQALAATKTEITSKHLPQKFQGYFEMPGLKDSDGENIAGIFVSIEKHYESGLGLFISYVTDLHRGFHGHVSLPLGEDLPLAKLIKRYQYKIVEFDKNADRFVTTSDITEWDSYINAIVNGILYITSVEADIIQKINNFSTKQSKLKVQQKIYTPKQFFMVGEQFENAFRKGLKENINVSAHWRFQACGPGYSQHKWTYIRPHVRNKRETEIDS